MVVDIRKLIGKDSNTNFKIYFYFPKFLTFTEDIWLKAFPGFAPSLLILYSKISNTKEATGMKEPLEEER